MTQTTPAERHPMLRPPPEEMAIRKDAWDEITDRYGCSAGGDVPDDALREFQQFLRGRIGGRS